MDERLCVCMSVCVYNQILSENEKTKLKAIINLGVKYDDLSVAYSELSTFLMLEILQRSVVKTSDRPNSERQLTSFIVNDEFAGENDTLWK